MTRAKFLSYLCLSVFISGYTSSPALAEDYPTPALPNIPDKTFILTDYGAKPDGQTPCTDAFAKAIAAIKQAGGGKLVVPAGKFLTGPFTLTSKLNLHLDQGATVLMTNDMATYPKQADADAHVDWITASDMTDLAITGQGTFDGQGQPWWDKYKKVNGVAPTGLTKRPQMFRIADCQRVLVQGVKLINSPNFHLIPQRCHDVTIDSITILSPEDAPNADGIDPSGWNFHIKNCLIDTGDDNIALKPYPSKIPGRAACEYFLIENCTFKEGHGLSIGGQTPGGVKKMLVRNCTWDGTDAGIRLKAPRGDGGLVEDLTYENLTMKNVKVPVYFTSYYPSIPKDLESEKPHPVTPTTPIWRNIRVTNLTVTDSPEAGRILGLPEMPIENLTFTNCHFNTEKGLRIANAKGILFKDSSVKAKKGPAITVHNANVTGIETTPAK